ncbi:MAG: hypothetical protein AAGI72_20530 [Pseudomonadota bacterium]
MGCARIRVLDVLLCAPNRHCRRLDHMARQVLGMDVDDAFTRTFDLMKPEFG